MPDKFPEYDPRQIWLQSTEPMALKLESHFFRRRAGDLRSKTRRELLNSILGAGLIAAGSVYGSIWTDSPAARALFALTAAWVLIGQFFLHRTKTQTPPPEEAGIRTSLDSCRRELERHIRFDRGALLWLHGPLFSLMAAFGALIGTAAGNGVLVKMAVPCFSLLVVWALGLVAFRQNQERKFRRAIAELDQMERER
jgi:hypothetical protein